jgi:hypothetical protein
MMNLEIHQLLVIIAALNFLLFLFFVFNKAFAKDKLTSLVVQHCSSIERVEKNFIPCQAPSLYRPERN